MKNKQFQLLSKEVIPSSFGFISKGSMSFATPLNHILKGFYFEGSSFSSDVFFLWVFFLPLYVPCSHVSFNLGKRLGSQWDAKADNLRENLREVIKKDGLSMLEKVNSPDTLAKFAPKVGHSDDPYLCESVYYSYVIDGDIKSAAKAYKKLCSTLSPSIEWQKDMLGRANTLQSAMNQDLGEAKRILIEWEKESVSALKLTKYHESLDD